MDINSTKLLKYEIKVCICTIGKGENLYIIEFVEHYLHYGVDKIFLYDNNELNGERFNNILNDYIKIGLIEIVNFRGVKKPQLKSYKNCFKKNYKKYDWLIFYDIDEFLFLKNYKNIKLFLKEKRFIKCQSIQLNWIFHTDNNLLYYDNRSLIKRFPVREEKARNKKIGGYQGIKSIIRGNIKIKVSCPHMISPKLISCDGFGNIKEKNDIATNISDFEYYYIDHYYSKSTEEFILKILKSDVIHNLDNRLKLLKIEVYFTINQITLDKINYIENKTKLDLTKYREKIKNKRSSNFI